MKPSARLVPAAAAILATAWGLASCGGDGRVLINVDVTGGESRFENVTLHIDASGSARKTFPGATFGPGAPFRVGIYLPAGFTGTARFAGEADDGQCIRGRGEVVVADISNGAAAAPITLVIHDVPGCQLPDRDAGPGDAASGSGGGNASGSGGAGTSGSGGSSGSGGGAAVGTGGAGIGSGGAPAGSGGAGAPGTGGAAVGTGGAGSGGRAGTGGAGTGGAGTGGAGSGTGGNGAVCPGCALEVAFTPAASGITSSVTGTVIVRNRGTASVPIGAITFKYWFTNETSVENLTTEIDYAAYSAGAISLLSVPRSVTTTRVVPARTNADSVTSFTFQSVALLMPSIAMTVQFRTHTPTFTGSFNSANDYSYSPTAVTAWPRITAYIEGALASGIEP